MKFYLIEVDIGGSVVVIIVEALLDEVKMVHNLSSYNLIISVAITHQTSFVSIYSGLYVLYSVYASM